MEDKSPILIDNGTAYCKAGFTGEEQPKVFLKTCVGYPKHSSGDFFIGADIDAKKGVLELNYPMKRGQIINFDDMEKIWSYIFTKELKVDPAEYNVMLTNAPMNPINKKEKITNIMFETFNVLGFYLALPHTLALYSAGIFTGIVADLGEGVNSFCPIFDGYPLHQAMKCFDFSGKDLTDYMIILLNEMGHKFSTTAEREIVKDIKEKVCYMALDFEEELKSVEPFDYELPDGNHIVIKDARIRCPEALFKPAIELDRIGKGIDHLFLDSIELCDKDARKDLYNNIVLSGGTSLINGLPERFTKEIKDLAPESMKEEIKVIASPERNNAVWIGGSILCSIPTFKGLWVTKKEYEESGVDIILKNIF